MKRSAHTKCGSTRRDFLKASAVVGAATIVPRHVLGGPGHVAPSDLVNVALVGAGGRGLKNARELMKLDDVRIVAVADPAEHWDLSSFYYKGVAGRLPACKEIETHYGSKQAGYQCRGHIDYREMLESSAAEFDAVLCATPDHMHAHVSLSAMHSDKHVYCEKPLTHNIAEARMVAKVAAEKGLATQLGNQGHSRDSMRRTIELLRAGVVGKISEVHAWVPATRWNPGMTGPPKQSQPVPKGVDWDLWCGVREPVEFHSAYAPVSWRDFWQFGLGAMGDFGCHDLDSAVWGLDLGLPHRIEMHAAGETDAAMIPYGEIGYFDFGDVGAESNKTVPEDAGSRLRITWYSGGLQPPRPEQLPDDKKLASRGVLFVGENGVMVCGGAGGTPDVYPLELRAAAEATPQSMTRSNGHHRDWIDAIKGGPPASSEFGYGAKLTEITLLGCLSLQTGETIDWDGEAMSAGSVDGADEIIHGKYRNGWKLPS